MLNVMSVQADTLKRSAMNLTCPRMSPFLIPSTWPFLMMFILNCREAGDDSWPVDSRGMVSLCQNDRNMKLFQSWRGKEYCRVCSPRSCPKCGWEEKESAASWSWSLSSLVYGVISLNVCRLTGEFGISLALGARRGDVLWLVAGHGLRLVLICVTLGWAEPSNWRDCLMGF